MARLLVFWAQPPHLSRAEADAWVDRELSKVTRLAGIERAKLTRLDSRPERFGSPHDWMLELHLEPEMDASECVRARPCAEWLGDLRLLGMHPAVVVADDENRD